MIKTLPSPWIDTFDQLLSAASQSLIICSPFIGRQSCARAASILARNKRATIELTLLTNLSTDNMLSGATDVTGLLDICVAVPHTSIRFLPNVHAKVYVADESCAVVTSANLTNAGMLTNQEYGLWISEDPLVSQIRADILEYCSLGSIVQVAQLKEFQRIVSELRDLRVKAEKSLRARLRMEFEKKLTETQEEILRVRAEGLTAHAVFADTVVYILRKGPKDTGQIYSEVRNIHPDLCDDSVRLVIRGQPWNQAKWHHRVRHAQLFLKRQGKIAKRGDKWVLLT